MKEKITLVFFLLGLSLGLHAQKVNYRITKDDPNNIKPISISLEPFYADVYSTNMTLGFSLRADALILKRMEARGDFRRAYLDMSGGETNKSYPYPKNDAKPALYFEGGVSLFFTNRTKKVNTKLVLSQNTFGNYTFTRYIMIPATKRKMWGIRGGAYNNRLAFELDNDKQTEAIEIGDGNGNYLPAPDNTVTMMNVTSLYGGLHWKSIVNVVASTDYGNKSAGNMFDFYIDFLFAPVVHLGDVRDKSGNVRELKVKNENIKRMGWRMGFIMRQPDRAWLSYKFELGSRPGFQSGAGLSLDNEKIFMMLTFGLNIPAGKRKS